MKICFISDIHGITKNLNCIERVMKEEKIDRLVCLGDLYYPGPNNETKEVVSAKAVKDFLTSYSDKIICMRGNCDSDVDLTASDFPICEGLSLIVVDGINIYITHGDKYSMTNQRKFTQEGVLVYGHEHIPYIKQENKMTFINTGSLSLPKDEHLPSYCIYENHTFTIYDIEKNIIDKIEI